MNTFKLGDRVVPISKTVPGWEGLENSRNWRWAREKGQPFLYISDWNDEEDCYVVCSENVGDDGDFFMPEDLIPYVDQDEVSMLHQENGNKLNTLLNLEELIYRLRILDTLDGSPCWCGDILGVDHSEDCVAARNATTRIWSK